MNQDLSTGPNNEKAADSTRRKWRWWVVLVCIIVGAFAQVFDVLNDRTVSNIITMVAALIATVVALAMFYRWVADMTSRSLAALVILTLLAMPLSLMRIRGFSGEIVPWLEFRFRPTTKPQELVADPQVPPSNPEAAKTAFPQFLGKDRNAVIETREFKIPADGRDLEEVWRIAIGEGWSGFAIQDSYCVTLEQRDKRECVVCYRLSDGALLWMHEVAARHQNPLGGIGPRSTPTISGDLVYTQGATGIVHCVKLETGELVWAKDLLELGEWDQLASEASISWGRAASPLLIDGLCVIPFGRPLDTPSADKLLEGRSLIAMDALTGEVRWTSGDDQISYASPVFATFGGVPQIVSVNEASVTGHEIESGAVLWTLDWPGQSNGGANCASAIPLGTSSFLIGKGYGTGSGVFEVTKTGDQWSVEERWKSAAVLKTKFTHACVDGDLAYALSDGTLECVDLIEGKKMWTQPRSSRYGHGQMLRVGDCLVVQAESGDVAFVEASPKAFREISVVSALGDKTWNVPSVAGRFLAVRNDSEAVLYRLPAIP